MRKKELEKMLPLSVKSSLREASVPRRAILFVELKSNAWREDILSV